MHRTFERTGHAAGMIFFLLGVGLLIVCFYFAYTMFTHPVPGLTDAIAGASIPPSPNHPTNMALPRIGGVLIEFTLKLVVLAFMIFVASQIASRGIHQYFAAAGPVTATTSPAPASAPSPPPPIEPGKAASENGTGPAASSSESPSSRLPKTNSPQ